MEPKAKLTAYMAECGVPSTLRGGLIAYIYHGHLPGDFLQAVLRNDLMDAISRADSSSLFAMRGIVTFLSMYAPISSYGNQANVKGWNAQKGAEFFGYKEPPSASGRH